MDNTNALEILRNFNMYCEKRICNRVCPEDKHMQCFAEYVDKYYSKKPEQNNAFEVHGIISHEELNLTGADIEDLFFNWLESLRLEFCGSIDQIDCNDDTSDKHETMQQLYGIRTCLLSDMRNNGYKEKECDSVKEAFDNLYELLENLL